MTCQEKILSNDYADLITDLIDPEEIMQGGIIPDYCYQNVDSLSYILHANRSQIPPISFMNYTYASIPKVYGLMQAGFDPLALIHTGIWQTQNPPLSLKGQGVIVALIDTGIDYTLPVFKNTAGNTRILAVWDQTIQDGIPPEGYEYGTLYTRDAVNAALRTERPLESVPTEDTNGHGTAMASVAAGSSLDNGNTFLGAAPEADIVVVKLKECKPYLREYYLVPEDVPAYAETDIMMGVKFAESFGVAFHRPVVICLGIGTNLGDHTGTSALAKYLNRVAVKKSRGIVVCGGNEGNAAHHFSDTLMNRVETGGSAYRDVEIRVGEENGFMLEFWGRTPDIYYLSVRSPGGETIPQFRLGLWTSNTYSFIFEKTQITIDSSLVEQNTGDELVVFRFVNPTPGIWTIRVQGDGQTYDGGFHMWLPITPFLRSQTYFLESNPYVTLTEPAMAEEVFTTSTYNDTNNSFYIESGRGFGRDGRIKPDVAAPGVLVPTILGVRSGSSIAAALAAGAVAQYMQWAVVDRRSLLVDTRQVKNHFIRGAVRESDLSYPSREWGTNGIIMSS